MVRHFSLAAAALFAAGAIYLAGQAAPQSAAVAPAVTILVTLGEKASAEERWDGLARVAGGALISTEGRQFSEGDSVTATGSWRCVTRKDEVAPYADLHYTEMRPGSAPAVLHHAAGVLLRIEPGSATRVTIETSQGNFDFALDSVGSTPVPFLGGRATAVRVPTPEKLTAGQFEDDEPSMAALPGAGLAAAWVAYRDRGDRIFLRTRVNGAWTAQEEVTLKPADIFRTSLVSDTAGNLWVFWSERDQTRWHIWARQKKGGSWQRPERLTSDGTNTFHRAASHDGSVHVVWQSFRQGQSDVYLKTWAGGAWSPEVRVSPSAANDWEPAVAAGPNGAAFVAWDTYDKGNYDIHFRSFSNGILSPLREVTTNAKFQAHAAVAADSQGRPWVAWNESGVNWGKDQGFLVPTPLATPLHQERSVRLAFWDGSRWIEPRQTPAMAFPVAMRQNAEHPQIVFDGGGGLQLVFRHWTRRLSRSIGSVLVWENYVTRFDGLQWSPPRPLPASGSWIEKHAGLARDASGDVWAAWMTDNRPFSTMKPDNADIYAARLGSGPPPDYREAAFQLLSDPAIEAIPVHTNEPADVGRIRGYTIAHAGRPHKIYRGDMHRHTDFSQDFKYDGSLIEVYRYAFDAAGFDYIVPTDHQTGYDQEYSWWQHEKLVDLFLIDGSFTPLFGSERSLPYPNGHRNTVFAQRGVRPLPIPEDERLGKTGAANLYAYLKRNRGISMPHSSGTQQGTNWRDNDPEVEPLMEIYQGYRTSYEYEGAPRAATTLNLHAQKSGWQPSGFWWNALAKGHKIGVQASSDHWSTHISYACIIADKFTREGLMDAMRKRHAYAATDNIVLDFQAKSGAESYLMGDSLIADKAPELSVKAIGTGAIKQLDLIKNQTFVYTARPGTNEFSFEFSDRDFGPGEHYYYVRVLQEDGQLAWSSPIWIKKRVDPAP